jgi:hypothetical protein
LRGRLRDIRAFPLRRVQRSPVEAAIDQRRFPSCPVYQLFLKAPHFHWFDSAVNQIKAVVAVIGSDFEQITNAVALRAIDDAQGRAADAILIEELAD